MLFWLHSSYKLSTDKTDLFAINEHESHWQRAATVACPFQLFEKLQCYRSWAEVRELRCERGDWLDMIKVNPNWEGVKAAINAATHSHALTLKLRNVLAYVFTSDKNAVFVLACEIPYSLQCTCVSILFRMVKALPLPLAITIEICSLIHNQIVTSTNTRAFLLHPSA